uniref:Uncharacterized protein n=1 Tax=Caenorhabditis japonica TaxID=281687 RepID=A0A8R1EP54_CAEJA
MCRPSATFAPLFCSPSLILSNLCIVIMRKKGCEDDDGGDDTWIGSRDVTKWIYKMWNNKNTCQLGNELTFENVANRQTCNNGIESVKEVIYMKCNYVQSIPLD